MGMIIVMIASWAFFIVLGWLVGTIQGEAKAQKERDFRVSQERSLRDQIEHPENYVRRVDQPSIYGTFIINDYHACSR